MDAHRMMGQLDATVYGIAGLLTNAFSSATAQRQADREFAAAEDSYLAGSVRNAAARAHSEVASDLRVRLIGAEAELIRLRGERDELRQERDELKHERKAILVAAGDLLSENERLRAAH